MTITIKTVARAAGVSAGTVSRVLAHREGPIAISQQTRERVLAAAERLKYRPNAHVRAMRSQRSGQLGLIVPDLSKIGRSGHAFADPNLGEVLSGIEERVTAKGYRLVLLVASKPFVDKKLHLEMARDHSVDGLLVWGARLDDLYVEELLEEGLHCVQVRSRIPGSSGMAVINDDRQGSQLVTEHLLQMGHRRIGFMAGPTEIVVASQRREGFQSAVGKYDGVQVVETQLVNDDFTEEGGYKAAKRLLREEPAPTAIVAFNDHAAFGVYRAAEELGLRVPEDLSVVGGDAIDPCRYVTPRLTTFRVPNFELGQCAAQRLIELVEDDQDAKDMEPVEVLATEFIPGQSCAPVAR